MVQNVSDSIDTTDGRMDIFVTYPGEDRTEPVVLFYMDALGIRENLTHRGAGVGAGGEVGGVRRRDGG